ncbi:MAG: cyclic pyranopterin monophosphate synthase MoaC [Erythrobacter sp.]
MTREASPGDLTHLGEDGTARMVDIGAKPATRREATAIGRITMNREALRAIRAGDVPKGEVLGAARIAGIMAAKRTGELIPLCHPLALDSVTIEFAFEQGAIDVSAHAAVTASTGVEMEAMVAATAALLTIYDMAKALDRAMVIEEVRLLRKSGGRSGDWHAPERVLR